MTDPLWQLRPLPKWQELRNTRTGTWPDSGGREAFGPLISSQVGLFLEWESKTSWAGKVTRESYEIPLLVEAYEDGFAVTSRAGPWIKPKKWNELGHVGIRLGLHVPPPRNGEFVKAHWWAAGIAIGFGHGQLFRIRKTNVEGCTVSLPLLRELPKVASDVGESEGLRAYRAIKADPIAGDWIRLIEAAGKHVTHTYR